jgi:hypothetical protein
MPSPGRQISGMASYENCCGWVGWERDATRVPACKIVDDPAITVKSLIEV